MGDTQALAEKARPLSIEQVAHEHGVTKRDVCSGIAPVELGADRTIKFARENSGLLQPHGAEKPGTSPSSSSFRSIATMVGSLSVHPSEVTS